MTALSSVGLPEIIAGIMLAALNAYVLTGGADFGGGVWDLLASGPSRDEQRSLIERSIAPIWEANHVWLIVVVVLLFSAFPTAFGVLGIVLHIPLSVMLVGIVLRGSAFVFRSYGRRDQGQRWGIVFAVTSLVTPVILGMIIGAIVSDRVGDAATRVGSASFIDVFVKSWLSPFTGAVGLFALALFAFLAATYLTVSADTETLREAFRRRALGAALAVFIFAGLALALSFQAAPRVAHGVAGAWWSMPLHLATGLAAVIAIISLWRRRFRAARIAAGAQVSLVLWGWAFAQLPYLIPPTVTIRDAASPRETLTLLLGGLCAGFIILIPSLRYLYRTFAHASEV
ncbi:MAG TPA: cytochrome d ubiquinol oxidase subunit II [Gemmatimonadaceae bacterium]